VDAIQLAVQSRREGSWSIVDVDGEVDVFTAPRLRERIIELVDKGQYRIIVNLEAVSFMDSTGLGVLVGGLKRVREHDGVLALVCTRRPVLRVLALTGLNRVFPLYETVASATAAG
jgi:anti-sigma B factor antagonist